jgi:hypothetical protein
VTGGGPLSSGEHPKRRGIYTYQGLRQLDVLVLSIDQLVLGGTAIVCDVTEVQPLADGRSLLAVQLGPQDPYPGHWVLAWRLNHIATTRLDLSDGHRLVTDDTMRRVVAAVNAAIDPLE